MDSDFYIQTTWRKNEVPIYDGQIEIIWNNGTTSFENIEIDDNNDLIGMNEDAFKDGSIICWRYADGQGVISDDFPEGTNRIEILKQRKSLIEQKLQCISEDLENALTESIQEKFNFQHNHYYSVRTDLGDTIEYMYFQFNSNSCIGMSTEDRGDFLRIMNVLSVKSRSSSQNKYFPTEIYSMNKYAYLSLYNSGIYKISELSGKDYIEIIDDFKKKLNEGFSDD
jgi:hypothetical protein